MPGVEGDPAELTALVAAFTGPQEVYALAPLLTDSDGQPIASIERIAQLMVPVVQELSPGGSYRLAGYSFGALVVIELGHQLRAAGRTVDAVFLIDAYYDERFWSRRIWLQALARRTGGHLRRIAQMPAAAAIQEFRLRANRLLFRVMRRGSDVADPAVADAGETVMSTRALSALAGYRPRFYDGALTLIAASDDAHFGCDPADIWSEHVRELHVQRVRGDHLTILKEPDSAAAVAQVIDHHLGLSRPGWTGLRPTPGFERPMIVTTVRWFSAARLAHALSEAGFSVSACRPPGHPLDLVDALSADHRLNRMWPLRSIAAAIRAANPDLVICDDEPALAMLRRLHARVRKTDPDMAMLLARSLGNVEDWPSITSRTEFMKEACALDVASPRTAVIGDVCALRKWVTENGLPAVLKTDGSWGGRGVVILRDPEGLARVWRAISNPPSFVRAVKRTVFDHELNTLAAWRRRDPPVVNAQEFCSGRDAIVTAASVDGKTLALVCLEVVQTYEVRGPAAVVRVIDHPEMAEAARQLIRRFGLSGFSGFDFMVDDDGNAHMLEMNPRVTPTAHLLVEGSCTRSRLVGLFPFEIFRHPSPGAPVLDILDVPVRAPLLIEHGTMLAARRHRPVPRAVRHVAKKVKRPASDLSTTQ